MSFFSNEKGERREGNLLDYFQIRCNRLEVIWGAVCVIWRETVFGKSLKKKQKIKIEKINEKKIREIKKNIELPFEREEIDAFLFQLSPTTTHKQHFFSSHPKLQIILYAKPLKFRKSVGILAEKSPRVGKMVLEREYLKLLFFLFFLFFFIFFLFFFIFFLFLPES